MAQMDKVAKIRLYERQMFQKKSNNRKFPKYYGTQKICCNPSKIWTLWLHNRVMSPKNADGMANI